ncbi:SDR family NAD(P)-dependent oxidoreductase [Microbacterium chocolatum]|uniref:SDR family NAD(P)-dependent oxidoreductase n=1 Tax=Microbacterium aurantiacum TaxID=162393 RepID=UPI00338DD785
MTLKLPGRTAFVTGAGSGMGRAISRRFAAEGANVVAVDLNSDTAAETAAAIVADGGSAVSAAADVRDREQVAAAVQTGLDAFGGFTTLVNNAGIFDNQAPLLDTDDALWDRVIGINLLSAYVVTKAVLPHIIAAGGGTVISTASVASFVAGSGGAAYTTSKHGILGFTKQLALDYAPHNVRANAICPGAIDTGLTRPFWEADPSSLELFSAVPARRVGDADDIARLAVFLASDDSSFIYGTGVVIDGGFLLT